MSQRMMFSKMVKRRKSEDDSVQTLTNNHNTNTSITAAGVAVSSSNDSINCSRSHSDVTPNNHPLNMIKDQSNKSISSDQLRALAASYANVVGDRVRPNAILNKLARSGSLQPTSEPNRRLLTSSRESVVRPHNDSTSSSTRLDVSTSTVTSSSPPASRVDLSATMSDDESKTLLTSSSTSKV